MQRFARLSPFIGCLVIMAGCTAQSDFNDVPGTDSAVDLGAEIAVDTGHPTDTGNRADTVSPDTRGSDVVATDTAPTDVQATDVRANDVPITDVTMADVVVDAGPQTPSQQIAAVRAAAPGPLGTPLAVAGVLVTYLKPMVAAGDLPGFFVQADPTGPGLYVEVDPTTTTPVLAVGDQVSFNVLATDVNPGMFEKATMISGLARASQGNSIASLIQNVSSATDLSAQPNNYEAEILSYTGTVATDFASSGTGYVSAQITTAGQPTAATALTVRMPATERASVDLTLGCAFTLTGGPMLRFNTVMETSSYIATEIHATSCPAPRPVSAVALTASTVTITFSRNINPTSVTADGSQFTIPGVTVSGAVATTNTVTLTTGVQPSGSLTITVGAGVNDSLGTSVVAPNNTVTFQGFQVVAQLVLNEVNPNLPGATDLIELRALTAGTIGGIRLQQDVGNPTPLTTLPVLSVAAGDLIVVHFTPATNSITTETTTRGDCVATACYAGAWDIAGGTTGLTYSNRVLEVIAPDMTVQDAVAFAKATTTSPNSFPPDIQAIQAAALWLPANCGGSPCNYTSSPLASDATIAADWTMCAATVAGISVQRHVATDNNRASDWQQGASSWGLANP